MRATRIAIRLSAATALVAGLVVAAAVPASAHICTAPAQVEVGKSTTVSVGVTVEAASPKDISILIPPNVHVDQIFPHDGWTGRPWKAPQSAEVLFEHGTLPAYSCAYFPLKITVKTRGVYVFNVDQLLPSGEIVRLPTSNDVFVMANGQTVVPEQGGAPNPMFEQVVYAGVPVGSVSTPSEGGGGVSPVLIAVAVAAALALVWFGLRFRDRRATQRRKELVPVSHDSD